MSTREASAGIARPKALVVRAVNPVVLTPAAEGYWFIDFGRAAFGTIELDVECHSATVLQVDLGERLSSPGVIDRDPPGCVRYRHLQVPVPAGRQTVRVVIPPDAQNIAPAAIRMPADLFEVLPFRYAEVHAPDASVKLHAATQLAVNYPFDETAGAFSCSDERLNRVWELCRYSIQATSFCGVYVDGDRERIPYEGDAYLNQLSHYGVDSEYELARHSLEYLLFHPTWPTEWALHCVPMAWADYEYTGDTALLETYYEVLREKTLLALAREDGLISTMTGLVTDDFLRRMRLSNMQDLVDWPPANPAAGVPGERDGYDMVPVKTVVNAFHCWNLDLFARLAGVLGREEDRTFFTQRHRQVVESLQRVCFDASRGIYVDGEGSQHASLHANMLPAAFGLVPPGHRATVTAFLRSRGMACSVYGAQFLLEALYRLGDASHALALMTAQHDRGWLHMLDLGSTIALEAWDTRYKANLDWNHAWGAAPANIIPRCLMGVRPQRPGFRSILIAPQPASLQWAKSRVPTPHGPVLLEIEQQQAHAQVRVTVPNGCTATVDLTRMVPADCAATVDGKLQTLQALRDSSLDAGLHHLETKGR
ncbi:MAG: alpha-L-rhamnosidase C-terminal domain-containing protein [Armatimonadia bacterium]